MKIYNFTPADVYNWRNDLYSADLQTQLREQALIGLSPVNWATVRFSLTPSQVAYFNSLSPAFIQLIADELVAAINYHLPISLEKEFRPYAVDPPETSDSVKVTELRKNSAEGASYRVSSADPAPLATAGRVGGELVIVIYYKQE